jgi:hypothetical protein
MRQLSDRSSVTVTIVTGAKTMALAIGAVEHMQGEIQQALTELKKGMDEGPGGHIELDNSHACLLYRILTECYGVKHEPSK